MKKQNTHEYIKLGTTLATFLFVILFPMLLYQAVTVFMPKPKAVIQFEQKADHFSKEERKTVYHETVKPWQNHRDTIMFSTFVIGGIITFILGLFLYTTELGLGSIITGSICIIAAYLQYWTILSNLTIFLSLFIAIITLALVLLFGSKLMQTK